MEADETINLSLSNPTNGVTLGTQTTAVLTIINDDLPQRGTISLNNSNYTVNENNGTASITLTRTNGSDGEVSVILTPSNGSAIAGDDYTNTPITVTFANGETSKTVTIPINNDTIYEPTETVNLTLSNPTGGATLGTQQTATLTIIDNDAVPGVIQFSNGTYSINENGTPVTAVTLTRTNGSDGAVSVRINLTNGTATAGSDYNNNPITINFANGETTKSIIIPIIDDSIVDPNQTINLTLTTPTGGATIGTQNTATVTIVDNDNRKLTLVLNKDSIYEGETATGTITRNTEDTSSELVVNLNSSDTTEVNVPQTVTIPVNQSSTTFTLTGVTDNIFDSSQTATITASSTQFENGTATIVVKNNDLPDLIVSNIIAPNTAQSGQTIDVAWTITNQGNTNASGTWSDRVFLSDNDSIGNDLLLGTFSFTGTIASGTSITRTQAVSLPLDINGNRRIVVQSDIFNQIQERLGSENNNTTIDDQVIKVNLSPYPNLQVASVTAPTTAFSSQETVIKWVVTNTGNGNTNTPLWYDRVWLSLDQTLDSSDIYLGQAANSSYLNVGESYSNTLNVTLPVGIDSNYYFLVQADGTNQVWEFDREGDNITASNVTDVDLTPPPDLQIASVIVPASIFSGQKINLNWTVENRGAGKTFGRYWYDDIYLSLDQTIDTRTDYYLGRQQYNSFAVFDSGASYSVSKEVELPVGISGNYYFLVRTDAGNYVFEQAFKENNTGSTANPVNIRLTPPPDLEVDFVDAPASATASRPLTFNYRVTNYGSTRTPNNSWSDSFYLSTDNKLDIATDYKLGDRSRFGALNVDEFYTASATFSLPNTLTGTFYLFAIADSSNQVFELDNNNNSNFDSQVITITSRPADLIVSGNTSQSIVENGKSLRVNWTTTNQGIGDTAVSSWSDKIVASKDNILGNSDDVYLSGFTRNGLLNVGASYSRSELVTIPFNFTSGDYNLFVVTDANQNVYEASGENNNSSAAIPIQVVRRTPDLQVTQITAPSTSVSGQPFTVTWKVENLGENTTNVSYWYDEVFLSTDAILNQGDLSLGTIYQARNLDPSGSYQTSRTFTLPADIQGNYYVLVRTDIYNYITEDGLENNNIGVAVTPSNIALSEVPDLVVNNLVTPTQAVSGQSLELTWTVKNEGFNSSGGWRDYFYLSRDRFFDSANDIYLGFVGDREGLNSGQAYTKTNRFTLPRGLTGDYYLVAIADATNTVYEREGENNNIFVTNTSIPIVAAVPTDLVAGTITIPVGGTPGRNATITYTVDNQGIESAIGNWQDSIYISADDKWDINDLLFSQVNVSGPLNSGSSYSRTVTANLPGVATGNYHVIIRSDIRNNIAESNESNNLKASLNQFNVDVASLTLGTPVEGYYTSPGLQREIAEIAQIAAQYGVGPLTYSAGNLPQESFYYKVDVAAGETLKLTLDGRTGVAAFDAMKYNVVKSFPVAIEGSTIYVRHGAVPTPTEYDYSFSEGLSEDQEITIDSTRGGSYYILTSAPQLRLTEPETPNTPTRNYFINAVSSGGGGGGGGGGIIVDPRPRIIGIGLPSYSLKAEIIDFSIQDISTKKGSNRGQVTMAIEGAKFTPDGEISLIANDGTTRAASKVWWKDTTEMWATFDLRGLATGLYDVRLEDGSKIALANDIFTVTDGVVGKLETQLMAPAALRPGETGVIVINYANTGETDIVAPLLTLGADNANFTLPNEGGAGNPSIQILGIDETGPAGILSPGETGGFSVRFVPTVTANIVNFSLSQASENETLDWTELKAETRPAHVSSEAWDAIWQNFTNSVGTTTGSYQATLAENANSLSQLGNYVHDVNSLLAFELQQSSNSIVGTGWDGSLEDRLIVGPFGRGGSSPWEINLTNTNGDVTILYGNTPRLFSVEPDGSYRASVGDNGTLTVSQGIYHLREADGTLTVFRADGKFNYIEDTNGIRLTASYGDGRLTRLESTWGNSLAFSYNAQGRIAQVTEEDGQTSNYEYDATGQYLLSVTTPEGTTRYTYYDASAAVGSQQAIKSVTFSDNSTLAFAYDSQGRVTQESWNNGARVTNYQYDATGGVTVTDAIGSQSQMLFNEFGLMGRLEDPLDRLTRFQYDSNGNLTSLIAPDNTASVFTYDQKGNVLTSRNTLGQQVKFAYEPTFNQLASVQDQKGNPLSYSYDNKGNLTAITYADGSKETFSRDAFGNVSVSTNRRGQPIEYTYNSQGLLTRKQYTDGTFAAFTYDGRGNLLSAIDADSSVSYAYDNADRLTKVTYGVGRYVEYGYDNAGRRNRMANGDGLVVNYGYDDLGQLSQLTDGNGGNIITYTYDAIGRLTREDNGNGTYTTYNYDSAGQLLSLVNYKADNTVNSRYDYTYDVMGRRTSMTTLEGTTNYTYDAIGQLTGVSLPNGRTIQYRYDAAGNRIAVTDSGVATNYSTNNLNQYTSAGGATFTYDTDGNLIRKQDGSQTWDYSYDSENRLVGVNSGSDAWIYEYDAIGNRIATIYNGQRTEYLVDPTGLGDVVGEYNGTGSLMASYAHGLGLVSRFDGSGASYYDADAIGSIVGLTGNSGTYLNQYSYLPFGESLSEIETISNPFEYVGELGVMNEGNGLTFMRARYYDVSTGRFTNPDPIGINGEDTNLYRYIENSPPNYIDPLGTSKFDKFYGLPKTFWNWLHRQDKKGPGDYSKEEARELFKEWERLEKPLPDNKGKYRGNEDGFADLGLLLLPWQIAVPWEAGWWIGTQINDAFGDKIAPYLDPVFDAITRIIRPSDPNDIVGPDGFGEENWLLSTSTLPYTIRFENQASATAPAQVVTITHPLDSDLDLRTFRLGDFGWSGISFDVPDNVAFYSQRLDLTASKGFLVDVAAGIDIASKQAFWTLTTIDPNTGEIPEDPSIGFLPPNNDTGVGDGFVNYTIRPGRNVTTGTVIDAQATIVFDNEAPIDTPPIFNTLDAGKPSSHVESLANTVDTSDFLVKWTGNDDANGSGIASFDVYVSENGGNFTLWLDNTTLTEASYRGQQGKSYAFYTVAVDNVGNLEIKPTNAQATTQIANSNVNQTPILGVNNGLTLNEASTATITLSLLQVTDADNTPTQLTYTLTTLPAEGILKLNNNPLSLNAQFTQEAINNNLLTYTHNGSETISDRFNFSITDGTNTLNNNLFGISINPVNDVPIVLNAIASQSTTEGQTFSYNFPQNTFVDNDLNEVLTYTATLANGNSLPTWLSFNAATRTFNGIPTADSSGTLTLVVTATDTAQTSVSNSFNLTILEEQSSDNPPTVVIPIADITVNEDAENTTINLSNVFSDVDGDVIVKSVFVNDNTGLVTATIVDNQLTLDYQDNQSGTANITIRGTSNGKTVDDTFLVTVNPVDDAPTVINPITDVNVAEDAANTVLDLTNIFSDVDNDPTSIVKSVFVNNNTGLVTATIVDNQLTLDYQNNQSGIANITIRGTSNGKTVDNTFLVTVNPVDDAPTVINPITDVNVNEDAANTVLDLTNIFTDVDNDPTSIVKSVLVNDNTGLVTATIVDNQLTLDYQNNQSGIANLTIRGTSNGKTVDNSFTITVASVNDAPTLQQEIANQTATENQPFSFTIPANTFTDIDGDNLTYTLATGTVLPSGITFDAATGTFSGTPSDTASGTYNLTVIASDSAGEKANDSFSLNVLNAVNGDSSNQTVNGTSGDDHINAGAGNDTVNGGEGNDILDGGPGNDRLAGGPGDDTYIVDSSRDVAIENAGQGQDTVKSSVNYTLTVNIENITLTGNANIDGTGNNLDNVITGNSGNNLLKGLDGNDTLLGSAGNDTLMGGKGNDILTGGDGSDSFLFGSGAIFNSSDFGVDSISDFIKGSDKIILSKTSFNALVSTVGNSLQTAEFTSINDAANELNLVGSSNAKIVYNLATGNLFYNQNGATAGLGNGALFATFNGIPQLSENDIFLQA